MQFDDVTIILKSAIVPGVIFESAMIMKGSLLLSPILATPIIGKNPIESSTVTYAERLCNVASALSRAALPLFLRLTTRSTVSPGSRLLLPFPPLINAS